MYAVRCRVGSSVCKKNIVMELIKVSKSFLENSDVNVFLLLWLGPQVEQVPFIITRGY